MKYLLCIILIGLCCRNSLSMCHGDIHEILISAAYSFDKGYKEFELCEFNMLEDEKNSFFEFFVGDVWGGFSFQNIYPELSPDFLNKYRIPFSAIKKVSISKCRPNGAVTLTIYIPNIPMQQQMDKPAVETRRLSINFSPKVNLVTVMDWLVKFDEFKKFKQDGELDVDVDDDDDDDYYDDDDDVNFSGLCENIYKLTENESIMKSCNSHENILIWTSKYNAMYEEILQNYLLEDENESNNNKQHKINKLSATPELINKFKTVKLKMELKNLSKVDLSNKGQDKKTTGMNKVINTKGRITSFYNHITSGSNGSTSLSHETSPSKLPSSKIYESRSQESQINASNLGSLLSPRYPQKHIRNASWSTETSSNLPTSSHSSSNSNRF
jgi:hypothetical protein